MFSTTIFLALITSIQIAETDTSTPTVTNDPVQIQVENAFLKTIKSTIVSARVPGVIDSLEVEEGSKVSLGQELGRLLDSTIRLQITRAEAAMEKVRLQSENSIDQRLAEKRSAVALNELERALEANKKIPNTYPVREVERLQLIADSALLEIERAQYDRELHAQELRMAEVELDQAKDMLEKHRIVSPVNGVVVAIDKSRGEWTEPGVGVLQIVQTRILRIEGFVKSSHIGIGLQGKEATVSIEVAGEKHSVPGKVTFVSPETNPVSGQVRVFLEIDNPDNLFRAGVRVDAVIDVPQQ